MAPPTKRKSKAKPGAARKRAAPAASLTDALAAAAWAQADAALATALAEFDAAETAKDEAERVEALALLGQALASAARRRGLARIGVLGAREPYEPKRHELAKKPRHNPKTVRIAVRGVSRGGEVLVKARAKPARGSKRQ